MQMVFRVEHARNCCGPYGGSGFGFVAVMRKYGLFHEMDGAHPIEGWDQNNNFLVRRWGFSDMDQLRRWFDPFGQKGYDVLIEEGYVIAVYEVHNHKVIQCARQLIFDISGLTRIEELNFPSVDYV